MNGWIYICLNRLNTLNTWRPNGFGLTITYDLTQPSVAYRLGAYLSSDNLLLLDEPENGGITQAYDSVAHAKADIAQYVQWYNSEREHSSLNKQTPDEAYSKTFKTFNLAA